MSTHESYPDRSPDDIAADNELRRRTAEPESHAGTVSESSTSPSYGQTERSTDQVIEKAQQTAGTVQQKATSTMQRQAAGQKDRLAQGLHGTAQAMNQVRQQLRDNEQESIANYADMAAERLRQVADYFEQQDVGQIIDDVENMARRQPAMVIGGAFALGFLAARFLKSSNPSSSGAYSGSKPYQGGYDTGGMYQERPSYGPYPRSPRTGYGTVDTGAD